MLSIGALELASGERLPDVVQRVTRYGCAPRADGANVVFVAHALSGSSRVLDWWGGFLGDGALFDPASGASSASTCSAGATGPPGRRRLRATGGGGGRGFPSSPLPTWSTRSGVRFRLSASRGSASSWAGRSADSRRCSGRVRTAMTWITPSSSVRSIICVRRASRRTGSRATRSRSIPRLPAGGTMRRPSPGCGLRVRSRRCRTRAKAFSSGGSRTGPIAAAAIRRACSATASTSTGILRGKAICSSSGSMRTVIGRSRGRWICSICADTKQPAGPTRLTFVGIEDDQLYPPEFVRACAERWAEAGWDSAYRHLASDHGHDAFLAEPQSLAALLMS